MGEVNVKESMTAVLGLGGLVGSAKIVLPFCAQKSPDVVVMGQ